MEFKVREVPAEETKSVQETEEALLAGVETPVEEPKVEEPEVEQPKSFGEEDVLSFIKERYQKELSSVDELFVEKTEQLPEDVSAFLKYKKETGRGFDDFMKLQRNYNEMNQDQLLREFYASTESDLDQEDVEYLIQNFSYDEELDDEADVKAKKIALKKELAKAKKYFDDQKEQYKIPVESAGNLVPEDELESYKAYKEYISKSKNSEEKNAKLSEVFQKKTEEVLNEKFEGFEFKIGEQSIKFSPGDVDEIKSVQSDITNFIGKYLDEEGMIKDAAGYHKALSAALNPDKLAAYFYEKGKSDAVTSSVKQSKNINMEVRQTPQQVSTSGLKFRVIENEDSGRSLKIKKRN
jgi:hypothetical protein